MCKQASAPQQGHSWHWDRIDASTRVREEAQYGFPPGPCCGHQCSPSARDGPAAVLTPARTRNISSWYTHYAEEILRTYNFWNATSRLTPM